MIINYGDFHSSYKKPEELFLLLFVFVTLLGCKASKNLSWMSWKNSMSFMKWGLGGRGTLELNCTLLILTGVLTFGHY